MPFLDHPIHLDIKCIAEACIKRHDREPDVATEYEAFMLEYLELGHMEKIPDDKVTDYISFSIPHHPKGFL